MNTQVLFISPDAQPDSAWFLPLRLVRAFVARVGFFPRTLVKWAASRGHGSPGFSPKLRLPAPLS